MEQKVCMAKSTDEERYLSHRSLHLPMLWTRLLLLSAVSSHGAVVSYVRLKACALMRERDVLTMHRHILDSAQRPDDSDPQ
jgi:hypothetical protein